MQISSDCADDNPRFSHVDTSDNLHPILNYSIQTGEEFSLEFLKERANARKNQNDSSGVNIKGIAGLQSRGSENEPKLWQKDSSAINNKTQNEPVASAQRVPCVDSVSRGVSNGHACSTSYNNSSSRMRFLCSYGGKILPRPSDGKLRYIGGDTHIIQIRKDISFQELMQKTLSISSMPHIIKYQLPGEDLDSLISVSCDEDLQNMIEEFNILEDDRSQKLRMFLFFSGDRDELQFSLGSKQGDSEIYYVAAVNCMEFGSTEYSTSHLAENTVSSDLDQLLNFGNGDSNATKNRVEMQSDRLNSVPLGKVLIPPMANSDIFPMHLDIQNKTSTLHPHQVHLKHVLGDDGLQPQKHLGPEKDSLTFGVLNEEPVNPLHELDSLYPVNQLQETDNLYPHRPYQSADLSRGTSTLLPSSIYRSKSHNCFGPQPQMPNPPPNLAPQDSLCKIEQSISSSKQVYPSPSETADADKRTENSSEIIEPTHTKFHDSISDLSGNRTSEFSHLDNSEFLNSQSIHNTKSTEAAYMGTNLSDTKNVSTQGQPEKALCDFELNILNPSTVAVSKQQIGSPSNLPGIDSPCTSQIIYPNNAMENECLGFESEPLLRDILADINNRFPPPLVSGIFKAKNQDSSSPSAIYNDKLKMTVNLQNPEQKNWSFFQNLAQDQFCKDFSLIDQDHVNYNYPPTVTMAAISKENDSTQKSEDVEIGNDTSQSYFGDEMHQENFDIVDTNAACHHQCFSSSGARIGMDGEGMQIMNPFLNAGGNLRASVSDYEEVKLDVEDSSYPFIGFLAGFDLNNLQSIKNEDLEELKELGSGSFGTVYHGKWRGTDVAIKRIKKSCLTGRSSEQERLTLEFWKEAEILSSLHHPNVVAFYGVVRDGPEGTLATVTEYMVNGSLRHVLIRNDSYLDHRKQLIIAMDTAFGMEYLHSKNIVHFDLKCDNLLVNLTDPHRPICKVGDFGLSKIKRNTLVSGGVRGTLPWMAPELLSSSKVSEKVDVFSFGIVMWEILTGEEPYANMHYGAIIGGIVNNTLRPPVPKSCDPDWRTLMEQCWDVDPVQRPSFTEIASRLRLMSSVHHRPNHK